MVFDQKRKKNKKVAQAWSKSKSGNETPQQLATLRLGQILDNVKTNINKKTNDRTKRRSKRGDDLRAETSEGWERKNTHPRFEIRRWQRSKGKEQNALEGLRPFGKPD